MWLGRLLCILAIFALSGLDRGVMQSYAWSTMMADRAPEQGFTKALDSTFSGVEPCHICQALEETETKPPIAPAAEELPKLYSPATTKTALAVIPTDSRWIGFSKMTRGSRSLVLEIATPPPQLG